MPVGSGLRPTPARGNSTNNRHEHQPARQSAIDAVGLGFMTGTDDDDDEDDHDKIPYQPVQRQTQVPPGLATNKSTTQPIARPLRIDTNRETQDRRAEPNRQPNPGHFAPLGSHGHVVIPNTAQPMPRPPQAAFIQPPVIQRSQSMSPHPLQAPKSPIVPAFARPSPALRPTEVKFSSDSILRGNSEETLLSKTTPKGAEFWRRFSVVVKEESVPQRSSWLSKNQAGSSRLNICIWIIFICIILVIGGVVGLVYFLTHNSPASVPKALGGSINEGANFTSSSIPISTSSSSTSSPLHTVSGGLPPSTTPPIPSATGAIVKRQIPSYVTFAIPSATAVDAPAGLRRHAKRNRH